MPRITHLESTRDPHVHLSPDTPQTLAPDGASLYVRYDLDELKRTAHRDNPARYAAASTTSLGMWRYRDVLPSATAGGPVIPVTLGEGWTPITRSKRYPNLLIKDEGTNPTGSFKARGLSMAVTMARHYGLGHLAVPSAGNAASALAAYAALAGIEAHLFMPQDVPLSNYLEAIAYGADTHMIPGLISDCARLVGDHIRQQRDAGTPAAQTWFDLSTLKEPFRVEGKKTMGYELAEQLGWRYPDAVFYPTGGGVGLIGMWKAFDEMEALGWIEPGTPRPRMFALQAAGCQPIVEAYNAGSTTATFFPEAETFAAGLRVPKPYADTLILDIVRTSGGKALATTDAEILDSILDYARNEGLLLSPEGAAATAAYDQLLASGDLTPDHTVVLFNTGNGLKYTDSIVAAMHLRRPGTLPVSLPVGGIITPT